MKKANVLQWVWINVASVAVTFKYCLVAFYVTSVHRDEARARIDDTCRRWSAALLRLIDLRWSVLGEIPQYTDQRRYIIMCNHASHYDIPLSFMTVPGSMRMLAKKELSKIPIFGQAMRAAEFIFIDRHNRERAKKDLHTAKAKMESGIVLWVSPEGTRSKDGSLLPFKKGCFHLAIDTQAVIIPMVIRDIIKVLPKGETRPHLGVHVEVVFGEPIDAIGYTLDQRQQLSNKVEAAMRQLMQPERSAA